MHPQKTTYNSDGGKTVVDYKDGKVTAETVYDKNNKVTAEKTYVNAKETVETITRNGIKVTVTTRTTSIINRIIF